RACVSGSEKTTRTVNQKLPSSSPVCGTRRFTSDHLSFRLTACPAKRRLRRDNARFLAFSRTRALSERATRGPNLHAADPYSQTRANAAPFGSVLAIRTQPRFHIDFRDAKLGCEALSLADDGDGWYGRGAQ